MSTITYYLIDAQGIFSGAVERSVYDAVPLPSTRVAPPGTTGTEVARWTGAGWEVLPEYPTPPTPEPAPEPVPQSVTMRQARLALLGIGKLHDVDTAIDSLPEPDRSAARIEWEYSQEVQRHNGFVAVLAPALGLGDEALDNLFRTAATL